jgi:hypothetical protein
MTEPAPDKRAEWLILAGIMLVLGVLRFSLQSGPGPYGVDGSYYAQVARNLYEGRGLVTSVCLYHQGLDPLPAPTNIYPLWPALLGTVAFVTGFAEAVRDLPRVLYLIALLMLYYVARRIAPARQRIIGSMSVAHLVVLVFGLTPIFFSSTTYPYTEGLAFTLASAALLTSFRLGPMAALAGGALAGMATLTRSQMLMLVAAIIAARGYAALRDRQWKELLLSIVGASLVLVPWLLYVATFVGTFSLKNLYVSYQPTAGIAHYPMGVPTDGIADAVALRLGGVLTAFNPWSSDSFIALFGAVALLVPIAAVHWLVRAAKGGARFSSGVIAVALSGALLTLMLAMLPQTFFRMWLFGWRHGLPLIFLIVLALVELIGFGQRYVRGGAMAVVIISILWGGVMVVRTVLAGPPAGLSAAEQEMSRWLEEQPPSTVVLTTNAQTLSMYSHANFRWATCEGTADMTRALLTLVRTDYVAIYERERNCQFVAGVEDLLQPAARFGVEPNRILLLRRRDGVIGAGSEPGRPQLEPHESLEKPQDQ